MQNERTFDMSSYNCPFQRECDIINYKTIMREIDFRQLFILINLSVQALMNQIIY